MDREEIRRRIMAAMPKPTEQQLRQHALDRALAPGMSEVLATFRPPSGRLSVAEFANSITEVADVFVEYLRGPEVTEEEACNEGTLFKVHESMIWADITEEQARNAVTEMQNRGILFRERA